ncbi:MAG: sugar-binding transcriptional regulator [Anaerolineaceae bacterium]|nr:sugar-binding transcriptional regulator [Anaerolineaceae bacterium]
MAENNQDELIVIAAWLYYVERLTHEEIAEQLHMSRVSITRLLQRARADGVVQFTITRPLPAQFQLGNRIKEKYNLRSVTIAKTMSDPDDTVKEVCRYAAVELMKHLCPNCRLGVAFSSTLSYMIEFLDGKSTPPGIIIQELAGTYLSPNAPYGISWRIAEKLNAKIISLPVPVVVQSAAVRDTLLEEPSIQEAFKGIPKVDLSIVGLGYIGPNSTLVRTGHFTPDMMRELKNQGAVGDILLHFYDRDGKYVNNPIQERMIILNYDDLLRIPNVIGVATGPEKVVAIHGALKSGSVHHLVTDMETAQAVLAE